MKIVLLPRWVRNKAVAVGPSAETARHPAQRFTAPKASRGSVRRTQARKPTPSTDEVGAAEDFSTRACDEQHALAVVLAINGRSKVSVHASGKRAITDLFARSTSSSRTEHSSLEKVHDIGT